VYPGRKIVFPGEVVPVYVSVYNGMPFAIPSNAFVKLHDLQLDIYAYSNDTVTYNGLQKNQVEVSSILPTQTVNYTMYVTIPDNVYVINPIIDLDMDFNRTSNNIITAQVSYYTHPSYPFINTTVENKYVEFGQVAVISVLPQVYRSGILTNVSLTNVTVNLYTSNITGSVLAWSGSLGEDIPKGGTTININPTILGLDCGNYIVEVVGYDATTGKYAYGADWFVFGGCYTI